MLLDFYWFHILDWLDLLLILELVPFHCLSLDNYIIPLLCQSFIKLSLFFNLTFICAFLLLKSLLTLIQTLGCQLVLGQTFLSFYYLFCYKSFDNFKQVFFHCCKFVGSLAFLALWVHYVGTAVKVYRVISLDTGIINEMLVSFRTQMDEAFSKHVPFGRNIFTWIVLVIINSLDALTVEEVWIY